MGLEPTSPCGQRILNPSGSTANGDEPSDSAERQGGEDADRDGSPEAPPVAEGVGALSRERAERSEDDGRHTTIASPHGDDVGRPVQGVTLPIASAATVEHAPAIMLMPGQPPSPRAALLAQLGDGLRMAAMLGDLDTVRALHAAIGHALAMPPTTSEAGSGASNVVTLTRERDRRGAR
ncbi:hypothetical protein [Sorangium sp. So ce128]|uniref:hypothetical protein n=1 Tax=Sorangium sp. So ce128 TaxID=3133281 RepID=UPI003F60B7C7